MARDPLAFIPKAVKNNTIDRRVSMRGLAVMCMVEQAPRQSVRDLAAALELNKPSVTRAAQALREMGLVEVSREGVSDERLVAISLTAAGREALQALRYAAAA